jgi:hypothetical protein
VKADKDYVQAELEMVSASLGGLDYIKLMIEG